jgi:hypothetical protein
MASGVTGFPSTIVGSRRLGRSSHRAWMVKSVFCASEARKATGAVWRDVAAAPPASTGAASTWSATFTAPL